MLDYKKKLILVVFMFLLILVAFKELCFASVVIQSSIDNGPWEKQTEVYPLKGQKVLLKTDQITGAQIKWYQIVPDISEIYKNANFPWDKNPYKWIGFAKIKYKRKELKRYRDQWIINPVFTGKSFWGWYYREDVGSFWIQAVIEKDGKTYSSPGLEDIDHRGLSPKVFRISIREKEGYLGYLTSFFNVPGVFGSVVFQSYNYIGVDCADVLMAAYARWKNEGITKNYNVATLVDSLPQVNEFDIVDGNPTKQVTWLKNLMPGDFIAVRSYGHGQYYHIGAIVSDVNQNGILDKNDLVLHAGPAPLHYSYLKDGGFNGHVVILRPSLKV